MSHADVYAGLHLTARGDRRAVPARPHRHGQWVEVDMAEALLHANDFVHWDLSPVDPGDYRPSLAPPYTPDRADRRRRERGDGRRPGRRGRVGAVLRGDGPPRPGRRPSLLPRRSGAPTAPSSSRSSRRGPPTFTELDALERALADAGIAMGVVRAAGAAATSEWAEARGATVAGRRPARRHDPDPGGAVAVLRRADRRAAACPRTAASTTVRSCASCSAPTTPRSPTGRHAACSPPASPTLTRSKSPCGQPRHLSVS